MLLYEWNELTPAEKIALNEELQAEKDALVEQALEAAERMEQEQEKEL